MKLRGAISGFGAVAERAHLPGWRSRRDVAIAAIHEPVSERRHAAIRAIRNVRVYDDLDLLLAGESPDFVDIASPPAHHADATRAALEAGVHVLVEKPLCLRLDEFDSLASLARARRRVLMCVHNWKHAPAYVAARALIDRGRIGAVLSVSLERLRTAPAGAGESGGRWRADAATGGGILIDHGWHSFYLMRWLLDAGAPLAISARLDRARDSDVEDQAELRVSFEGGRVGYANLSWRSPVRRTHAVIAGDRGTLDVEDDRIVVTDRSGAVEELPATDAPDDSYHSSWFAGMAADFEHAVFNGPGSAIAAGNLAEARACVAMTVAALDSARSDGRAVPVRD
ncbi:MAG: Gfo/Idh/MocA family protein [Candidatus Binataceae bacterium]